ncbi:MAG: GNAT family N-acetyltransferase [Acholeplasmataceae bacterium]|nr:GNAT family N-acetyltransferase [Acholeplasmataceae bacterium]
MIKRAILKDATFIYKLAKENLETTFPLETIKDYIKAKQTYHLFVCQKDEKIGFIILWESDFNGQIIDLVVKEKYRGLGYGKALLTYAVNFFEEIQVKQVSLEVNSTNQKALKLYLNNGFEIKRLIKNYYQTGDGLLLVRRLEK